MFNDIHKTKIFYIKMGWKNVCSLHIQCNHFPFILLTYWRTFLNIVPGICIGH
jgi:hypothetical protein